jgi:hypothetical protein
VIVTPAPHALPLAINKDLESRRALGGAFFGARIDRLLPADTLMASFNSLMSLSKSRASGVTASDQTASLSSAGTRKARTVYSLQQLAMSDPFQAFDSECEFARAGSSALVEPTGH